ncbi:MAG: GDP-mannose 4,6-dehydratase [Deltaproteobacteria bacterium]|uniref:GDP-mannose 4,6-dehydratase n=1 Tax=Candidatus Zymogenus saltonus TaxID=2844893 RepID=A0A9D8KD90_9DELT|nr:GDP-mannose 4,6-dehydratase [Candidatus Zymogenus saltonus]
MKKVVVTGGAGFIGSHLSDRLVSLGNEVFVIDNFDDYYPEKFKRRNIESLLKKDGFKLIEGDIRNYDFIIDSFRSISPDLVVHLAAKAGVRPSIKNPLLYQEVNVLGTNNILEAMKELDIKDLLFASSSSVYGDCPNIPFSEDDLMAKPISPYGVTKKCCEELCYTYHKLYNLKILCFRFFTVYGPRQRPDMAIHKFTNLINNGSKIEVYDQGKGSRDYTYIDDIIDGLIGAFGFISSETTPFYEIINLGESVSVNLLELIELIESGLGKETEKVMLPRQPGDVKRTFADIEKARSLLGYNPNTSMKEGVERFIEWFKNPW